MIAMIMRCTSGHAWYLMASAGARARARERESVCVCVRVCVRACHRHSPSEDRLVVGRSSGVGEAATEHQLGNELIEVPTLRLSFS